MRPSSGYDSSLQVVYEGSQSLPFLQVGEKLTVLSIVCIFSLRAVLSVLYQKKVLAHHEEMHRGSKFQLSSQSAFPLTISFVPRSNVYGISCGHWYCHWLCKLPVTCLKACSHTI